jgi:L-rhamnose mutarotase
MIRPKYAFTIFLLAAAAASGFSPYEIYLQSGQKRFAAVMAAVSEEHVEEVQKALRSLCDETASSELARAGISDPDGYVRKLQGKQWMFYFFEYEGRDYLDAVRAWESLPQVKALESLVDPHPRAAQHGNRWLQLEWITYIAASHKKGPSANRFAMVTRVRPEKEAEYRQLHQAVWPGVVDQMKRGNYRNFSIFFAEMGDELYEFFHVDYVGMRKRMANGIWKTCAISDGGS